MTQNINIDKLNLKELGELELRIKLRKEQIEETENQQFLDMIQKEAVSKGINLEKLLGGKIKKPRKKLPPKYENPDFNAANDDPRTQFWTGVGKPPKWIQAYEKKHGNRDAILIKKTEKAA